MSAGKIVAIAVGACCFLFVLAIILANVLGSKKKTEVSLEPEGIEEQEEPDMAEDDDENEDEEKPALTAAEKKLCKNAMTKATKACKQKYEPCKLKTE